jgi:hypothetical protein
MAWERFSVDLLGADVLIKEASTLNHLFDNNSVSTIRHTTITSRSPGGAVSF